MCVLVRTWAKDWVSSHFCYLVCVYVKGLSGGKGGKETDVCALVPYDSACVLHAVLDWLLKMEQIERQHCVQIRPTLPEDNQLHILSSSHIHTPTSVLLNQVYGVFLRVLPYRYLIFICVLHRCFPVFPSLICICVREGMRLCVRALQSVWYFFLYSC